MNINLLPMNEKTVRRRSNPQMIWIIVVAVIMVFSSCFYLGYLLKKIAANEAKLAKLDTEAKCYSTLYRKAKNIEEKLGQFNHKNELKKAIDSSYLPPLNALETLIQLKPELIWFEQIDFDSIDGNFTLTGGAINYKVLAGFIGKLEQDKIFFRQVKPENATLSVNTAGREYVQFKISGILIRRSETNG